MHQSRESLRLLWVDPSVCFSFGFLLEIIYMLCLVTQSSVTLCKSMDCSLPGFTVHGDSPGKNTEVGCLSFLQESSQSRDQTQVSCIAGRFFTIWATVKPEVDWVWVSLLWGFLIIVSVSIQIFWVFFESVFVVCVFPGLCPFHLGYESFFFPPKLALISPLSFLSLVI